jgi:hypothetical protein
MVGLFPIRQIDVHLEVTALELLKRKTYYVTLLFKIVKQSGFYKHLYYVQNNLLKPLKRWQ